MFGEPRLDSIVIVGIRHPANKGHKSPDPKVIAAFDDCHSAALALHVNRITDLVSNACKPFQDADWYFPIVFSLAARRSLPWRWPIIDLASHVFSNLLLGEYVENRVDCYLESCSVVEIRLSAD